MLRQVEILNSHFLCLNEKRGEKKILFSITLSNLNAYGNTAAFKKKGFLRKFLRSGSPGHGEEDPHDSESGFSPGMR